MITDKEKVIQFLLDWKVFEEIIAFASNGIRFYFSSGKDFTREYCEVIDITDGNGNIILNIDKSESGLFFSFANKKGLGLDQARSFIRMMTFA